MGVLLYDKNADFSGVSVGHAGLYTSVTQGLRSLFELRRSAAKTRQNNAPANDAEAAILANPAFSPAHIDLTAAEQVVFPSAPENNGEMTIAMIARIKSTGAATDSPVGSAANGPTGNGAIYFLNWNRTIRMESTLFLAQTAPAAYSTVVRADLAAPADGSLDDTSHLFVGTIKSENSAKLYWPARIQVATTPIAAGRFAYYAPSRNWRTRPVGTAQQSISMFAHWDRALTAQEVQTFYREMKEQFGLIGLAI